MRKALTYGAALIATYLLVSRATGTGTLISRGSSGLSQVVRTFQGR